MAIRLYAELLQHIKTISVQAQLHTESNQTTQAILSADGGSLTVTHDGEIATVPLPTQTSGPSGASLSIPPAPTKDLSFRLQLENENVSGSQQSGQADGRPLVPWLAPSLSEACEIACQACQTVIVPRCTISTWKDLPSEGWAEMMEFWHCHKPDEPHQHHHGDSGKGYAAGSVLNVERGVGLVDALELLLESNDCRNLNSGPPAAFSASVPQLLFCNKCTAALGLVDVSTGGYKLRKPQLSVSAQPNAAHISYSLEKWLSARVLAATESQGCRKFTIYDPSQPTNETLKIWVFALDMKVSYSSQNTSTKGAEKHATRAAKIFYRRSPPEARNPNGETLTSGALSESEIEVDSGEFRALTNALQESTALLPEKAKHFPPNWTMGLLRRFTIDDVPT